MSNRALRLKRRRMRSTVPGSGHERLGSCVALGVVQ